MIRRALTKALETVVVPKLIKEHEKIVSNWNHKPRFEGKARLGIGVAYVKIVATGPNAKYWVWVNEGTRPHTIAPKAGPVLRFKTGSTPKTTAGKPSSFGGPGGAKGGFVSAKSVDHPGTKAREFTAQIAEENKRWFANTMRNEWKRIIRSL